MSDLKIVLDRGGVLRLAGAIGTLTVAGFLSGTVLGVSYGGAGVGAPVVDTPSEGVAVAVAPTEPAVCVAPREPPADGRMAAANPMDFGAPEAPAEPPAEVPQTLANWTVQVGVFGVESNADRMAERLRARGYDPLVTAVRNRSGQWLRRVHVALYRSEAEALAAARTLEGTEGMPAVAVRLADGEPE